jgi:hypothetical protein
MEREMGFEPTASSLGTRRSLNHTPKLASMANILNKGVYWIQEVKRFSV